MRDPVCKLRKILKRRAPLALAVMAMAIGGAGFALAQEEGEIEIPAELLERLEGLPPEKLEFLQSNAIRRFARDPEKLWERLAARSPSEIEAYIDGMMSVIEESRFHPETDEASIPLNTESRGFNGWKVRRPEAFNPAREPGPINLNRYMRGSPKLGIPTFMNLPVALTPEDLIAGSVDVAIAGAGLDTSTGFRGAAYAPRALRTAGVYGGAGMVNDEHMHVMVSPLDELNVVDYGDIAVDHLSLDRSLGHIREMVREIASTGAVPMIVGGDHTLMYADVAGVVDVYGAGNVGVVHFDAHYDAGKGAGAHFASHGMPVYKLFKERLVPGRNFIQIGLRGFWPGRSGFEWMREHGLRYHTMAEIEQKGFDKVIDQALREAKEGPEYIFISFDVDVLDPAFMPGTGTPEPNGLTPREAFPAVRRLCAEKEVVGFELVELNPLVDPGYTSALNSDRILRECLTGIAMRKKGLTDPHYLSPLTTDHKQPSYSRIPEKYGNPNKPMGDDSPDDPPNGDEPGE
ncbi:MAG: hypothetical protein Tsb0010_19570 [Parvularculaceae bacterium]